ncbi:endothelial cell proliferation [Desmophyllum pertusum]|uniref:Endothelial cell proliferation n=1 Tax=Desmophyllum pertusum TaxID=174260 RepID=A0A9X0CQY9_9CNID|nr:endothelial cell proliferation [Desmophyllum pertusum]
MVSCAALNCSTISSSKVSTFKFPRMRRKFFKPSKHSRICAAHFTEDCFVQNIATRRLMGPAFKLGRINLKHVKDDAVPTIFNFNTAVSQTELAFEQNGFL